MRKRIVEPSAGQTNGATDAGWLNLSQMATVEVSSEQAGFPIEAVFHGTGALGWRASGAGEQLIRVVFDEPVTVARIWLRFDEPERERTQQITLSWSPEAGGCREILRQQWNFSPAGSTSEIEDHTVSLERVAALELRIQPDLARTDAVATLAMWRVAGGG